MLNLKQTYSAIKYHLSYSVIKTWFLGGLPTDYEDKPHIVLTCTMGVLDCLEIHHGSVVELCVVHQAN